MSTLIDDRTENIGLSTESQLEINDLALLEGLKDVYIILLNYYALTEKQEEREYVKKSIWYLTNKWLEKIAPINYIEGAVDKLSSMIKNKLWESNGVTEKILNNILVNTYLCRGIINDHSIDPEICINELKNDLSLLLEGLGCRRNEIRELEGFIKDTSDVKAKLLNIITIIALTLVLATNI
ncbi:MAG: hypothetical protein B6U89_00400 [Desulfurococcales archaeon ex4484_58]|nr:MAG: hypothetical protein B6U89_00400 [Desulfurococcales archaeon ex4484_58]